MNEDKNNKFDSDNDEAYKNPNPEEQPDDYFDERQRNYDNIQARTERIFKIDLSISSWLGSDCKEKIQTLAEKSKSLGDEANKAAENFLNEEDSADEEASGGFTEADKKVQANYTDTIQKQSSLLEQAQEIIKNGFGDMPKDRYLSTKHKFNTEKRENLLSNRDKLLEEADSQIQNKLENEENLTESSKDKGKRKFVDESEESTFKRTKKDNEDDNGKGGNTTQPATKGSLLDDFANSNLEMGDYTGGDD